MIPRPTARSGFSLTELLVSLVILGLISMAATSALSVGKQIWRKVETVPDVTLSEAEKNHLRQVMTRRIALTGEVGGGVSGTKKEISFRGLTRAEVGYDVAGAISVKVSENGINVQYSTRDATQTMHLKHLNAADLSYYGRKKGEKADGWFDAWESSDPAPRLVKFSFSVGGRFDQDELIVSLP